MEEKKTVLAEEGDNLGSVIKHLIDFDAKTDPFRSDVYLTR